MLVNRGGIWNDPEPWLWSQTDAGNGFIQAPVPERRWWPLSGPGWVSGSMAITQLTVQETLILVEKLPKWRMAGSLRTVW